jgi:uncharacterized protein YjbJ (UPF0337 family)
MARRKDLASEGTKDRIRGKAEELKGKARQQVGKAKQKLDQIPRGSDDDEV